MINLKDMRETGVRLAALSNDEFRSHIDEICRLNKANDNDRAAFATSLSFLADWSQSGAQVYELQHSVAALLAATRSPEIDWERLPHQFFIVKVPAQFAPSSHGSADTLIAIHGGLRAIGVNAKKDIQWLHGSQSLSEEASDEAESRQQRRQWRVAIRLAANAIAFITTYRECVAHGVARDGRPTQVATVSAPRDVVVDREFRDRVAQLVSAGSIAEIRRALSHVVRGHWRNQAVGPKHSERRLTWIRPHRRGDESVGRVVARTERI